MFNKLFKVAAACLLAFSLCGAANFTTTHGKLKVSGGKILDKNNDELVLRGMSLYWYNGPWGGGQPGNQFYNSTVVSDLANNWGANVVRAAIGNVQQNPSDALTMAKLMIDWANSAGIYVIIDNHSHIAHRSAHATAANNFFKEVSAYVKTQGYTHVIYEIYNEPVCDNDYWEANMSCNPKTSWAQIKTFAEKVIPTIRANDPDGLIIVGTPNYSSDISSARQNPLTGDNARNVLYTLHFYAGESGHSNYRSALNKAYCEEFPVFVTEWGTSPSSGNGTINTSNSNTWLSLLEEAKVSHVNWSLSNTSETSAALYGNSITSNLTPSGTYIKNIMKLNNGASLSSVGLSKTSIDCSGDIIIGPDGRITFGSNGSLTNFASKDGADSATGGRLSALVNKNANFTADYTFIGIEKPGTYWIKFYASSTASGVVKWSGQGISNGQAEIANTGSLATYAYTEPELITINEYPETPLNLSFEMPSANTINAVYAYTYSLDSLDSIEYEDELTPILKERIAFDKMLNFNSFEKTFIFEKSGGTLSIYNLRGEQKALFAVEGKVSLKALSSGTYLAVYRRGSLTSKRTIYLK